jgi:hypothetical protein
MTLMDVVRRVRGVAACCATMALAASGILAALPVSLPPWLRLACGVSVGVVAFIGSALIFRPLAWIDTLIAARTLRQRAA